jgi:DNA-binding NtrC family response regulator
MDLIDQAIRLAPEASVIVITAYGGVETAVGAMKKGAKDYLCKPLIFDELIFKLKRILSHDHLARQNRLLRAQIMQTHDTSDIVARSSSMKDILNVIQRVASTMSNVLFTGDSGTGKEILARALHYGGITRDRPFLAVNCGGLVNGLVESELFGHRRGAFTGADSDHTGFFEAADGGTLFLDEIANLPLTGQAVLLRAIEEKAVTRVGDNRSRPVNIRIVAATNRDVEQAVESGKFREDLYFRLNVVRIEVPPLRERPEDIPAMVDHFVKKYNAVLKRECPGFDREAIAALCAYHWPGNVRELENVIERALIFTEGGWIGGDDLSGLLGRSPDVTPSVFDLRAATREFERQHIKKVLATFSNKKNVAAESLGIALSSLYRKIEELDIVERNVETSRRRNAASNRNPTGVRVETPKRNV